MPDATPPPHAPLMIRMPRDADISARGHAHLSRPSSRHAAASPMLCCRFAAAIFHYFADGAAGAAHFIRLFDTPFIFDVSRDRPITPPPSMPVPIVLRRAFRMPIAARWSRLSFSPVFTAFAEIIEHCSMKFRRREPQTGSLPSDISPRRLFVSPPDAAFYVRRHFPSSLHISFRNSSLPFAITAARHAEIRYFIVFHFRPRYAFISGLSIRHARDNYAFTPRIRHAIRRLFSPDILMPR